MPFVDKRRTNSRGTNGYGEVGRKVHGEEKDMKGSRSHNAFLVWGCFILCNLLVFLFIHIRLIYTFPKVVSKSDVSYGERFSEEKAREHLDAFVSFGPRVTGSHANEHLAFNYIFDTIEEIEKNANPSKQIVLDIQTVTGAFHLENIIKTNFYHVYQDLKNIVVKLTSSATEKDSILINCHYDSVSNSPGAGDNAVSCAVMLDVLRVLSQSSKPILHDIIFLFNGAEENILQASHGFITQHKWRESVKAFVNLDSAGAGGWELVFQTGPEHPWLVAAYAESAPHPFGTVIGQELFQTGLIPSDTDFRIFRDFGNIPGIDIAHVTNGFIYHTVNDIPKFIPQGCLQRAGENIFALLSNIASSPKLADPGVEKHGEMVFFDVVGMFMIHYPKRIGTVMNYAVVCFTLLGIFKKVRSNNVTSSTYIRNIMQAIGASLAVWILTLVVETILAFGMASLGYSMFWYTNAINIFLVFVMSAVATVLSLHHWIKTKVYQAYNPWYVEELYFDASSVILSVITLCLTSADVATTYVFMTWTLFPMLLRGRLADTFLPNWKKNTTQYITITLAGVACPLLITMVPFHVTCTLFVPIMGRAGTKIIPDIPIALFSTIMVLLCSQFCVSAVYICRSMKSLLSVLWGMALLAVLVIILTPLGFPFNANRDAPSQERAIIVHTDRNFYDIKGNLRYEDSGIWLLPFDFTRCKLMMSSKFLQNSKPAKCDGPYCGKPYLIPVAHLIDPRQTFWYDTPKAFTKSKIKLKLTRKHSVLPDVVRFTFELEGQDHMSLYIRPIEGHELVQWSLTRGTPVPSSSGASLNETVYWVYYSYGEKPDSPWEFYLDFKVSKGQDLNSPMFDLVVPTHHLHGNDQITPKIKEFVASLPEYVVPSAWSSTFNWFIY